MEKIITFLGSLFIIVEILTIIASLQFLFPKYKYTMAIYKEKVNKNKKIYIHREYNCSNNVVKSNMTQMINCNEINSALYYPTLKFYLNSKEIKSIPIDYNREKIFIGRSKSDDIIIDDPMVSRSQCYITKENDNYFINLGINRNPVLLNEKQISESKKLIDGDIISMANNKIYFKFVYNSKTNDVLFSNIS